MLLVWAPGHRAHDCLTWPRHQPRPAHSGCARWRQGHTALHRAITLPTHIHFSCTGASRDLGLREKILPTSQYTHFGLNYSPINNQGQIYLALALLSEGLLLIYFLHSCLKSIYNSI